MRKEEASTPKEWAKYLKRTHAIRLSVGFAAMVVLTIMVALMYYFDFDIVLSMVMMGSWAIVVPAAAFSMAAFARGCRLHTKWQYLFFTWFLVLAFFVGMYMFVVYPPISGGMNTVRYMEDNYDNGRLQFKNLTSYVDNNIDKNVRFAAEWGKMGSLEMLEAGSKKMGTERLYSPSSRQKDSLLASIGMTDEQFETLAKLVDKCDCRDIEVLADGVRLGYRKVGYGEYYYFLPFKHPCILQKDIMYDIVPYNDSVFFEYAGGNDGMQEFPPEVKNHYLRVSTVPVLDVEDEAEEAE